MSTSEEARRTTANIDAVVFDLGKVLLDWSPAYYFGAHFPDDEAGLAHFLAEVITPDWITQMDAGKSSVAAIAELSARHPEHAALIALWPEGWPRMLRGEISGTVEILARLRAKGTRLYSITNFSTENYPIACERFDFLGWFEHTVVSGEVGLIKPDRRIFELAIERCRLDPARSVFIDDMPANVEAARACGFHGVHFTAPEPLHETLTTFGLL